jgi:DNA-binding transcriptional LysR family regulator
VQSAGVSLQPVVEVESSASALALAARGVGDTVISLPLAAHLGFTERLHWVSLSPPLHENFAFITRRKAHPSPATRVLIEMAGEYLQHLPHSAARASHE